MENIEMTSNNTSKNFFDVTSYPPYAYALFYFINIISFALIYNIFFSNDFKSGYLNFIQATYFSVVTVTTLGFGDITPKLDSSSLLIAITTQVVLGVITIGLFLNGISQKLSDKKDKIKEEHEKEIEEQKIAKLLIILKPIIVSYLEILAETYKVTFNTERDTLRIRPKSLFNQDYFDQISVQNFSSQQTRYGSNIMSWGKFIDLENNKLKESIDNYLIKFSTVLTIDIVELLVNIKDHHYLNHAKQALNMAEWNHTHGVKIPPFSMLSIEHSSIQIPEKPTTIKDFHNLLLTLIDLIEKKTKCESLEMIIYLQNGTAPSVGSAIAPIIKFGPF
ncbi:potassium channel family protein [Citrobacter sp. wls714]|uniref:potassium channel family protein n=1 Tax=Citrobacter sp. wls714 TaxID=2576422 RepID=UPI0010CA0263|nr:ion channel [Citrobacter sp. wls714]TKU41635.1 two pore domain potassium channel family protein [Citrobacter sp. wls714]